MKLRKIIIFAFLVTFLCIIYSYVCAIDAIPSNTILFKDEKLNVKTLYGLSLKENNAYQAIQTSTSAENLQKDIGNKKIDVKLFDKFTVKEVNVGIIERTTVIPVGQVSGLKLYTNGVIVVGMSEIKGTDNKRYKPYENSGIQEGDIIIEVDGNIVTSTDNLIENINASEGRELRIKYIRDEESEECFITPIQTSNSEYKIGLWVRDSAAGIGTLTFYEPNTDSFAALGHGITDIDTGELIDISNGEFITTKIVSIIKGKEGEPGKIQGSIDDQIKIGMIYKNTIRGVYGLITDLTAAKIDLSKGIDVATRNEIELGEASVLCSLDGEEPKQYKVQIEKIFLNNDYDNKSMLIKVTDDELLETTGGIIQGMSGCPIIQNGKFIGAVTNVMVR